jgi:hypothetical protein
LKLEVVENETGKIVWTEEHKTKELADKAVEELKKHNFNPNFFTFNVSP